VNLTGEGDAFLNPDYLKMIRYLKAKGVSVYLVDSFDLINKEIAYELVNMGVDGIYVSMDAATKETYEKIKVGCRFDRVTQNLKNLLEIKRQLGSPIPEMCFRFVINKLNVHEMADFVKLVRGMGTRREYGDGSKIHYAGLLDYPEIHDMYMPVIPDEYVKETLAVQRSDPENLPVVFAHTEPSKNPSIDRCLAWMEPYFAIVPHNMVLPCCAVLMSNSRKFLSEYCFGDYTKEPFRKIWSHSYYKWFRATVTRPDAPVPALCRGCRAYDTTWREKRYGIDTRRRADFE
jgi:MoaA/NifB/PqqE/SkfB family radical SAM enzyme